jgi:succinyl-CoA synthetase beta subunit/citryl-CoA synthetase large subunit
VHGRRCGGRDAAIVIPLLEDDAKAWLRDAGFTVPAGATASTAADAARITEALGGDVVVKALVPMGRRGKAGAVVRAASATDAAHAASRMLGMSVGGLEVREVYVEAAVAIARELYAALLFDDDGPRVVVCAEGGVDIEVTARTTPTSVVGAPIDPLRGLAAWQAIDLWRRAGIHGPIARNLGDLTARLYQCFADGDAELLEINPLAVDAEGNVVIVGAMTGIDPAALGRQLRWRDAAARARRLQRLSPRERRVADVDAEVPGPEARYIELDGDIGLLVGGGGAGLYQQDRLRAWGGRPANHSVTPPTGSDRRKLRAVIEAILEHPGVLGLLVGFNYAQMARADVRVTTLMDVVEAKGIDTRRFPIVIRMLGAGEADARARVAGIAGIHYLPRDASLEDAVRLVVELVARARESRGA